MEYIHLATGTHVTSAKELPAALYKLVEPKPDKPKRAPRKKPAKG
jgi:hypothetical protein